MQLFRHNLFSIMPFDPPYIMLRHAVSADTCALLSDYARFKEATRPKRRTGNDPLADIHREYGDPLMEMLLEKLTPQIEQATGLNLWPTLSFYYTYKNRNELKPHKDRSSCEIVAGLCIGVDPAFKASKGTWPLVLNCSGKTERIDVQEGDLLIFKGHETEHWREPFQGTWFVSAIFGYVNQQGPFAFQKYDQRQSLGQPHIGMLRWLFGCLLNKSRNRKSKRRR